MMDIKSPVAEARNEYTYSASGQKLKVVQKWNPSFSTAPVIGSGINTTSLTQARTTDYTGNIIYENNALKRILVNGGYYEGGVYYYYLADHLGNNHVVVKSDGTSIQSNSYYPFGMHYAPGIGYEKQPYKYNNKELDQMHGLNLYDNLARLYDPVVPHTPMPDPHAENYYSLSPYSWAGNNPMRVIDPTGMDTLYFDHQGKYSSDPRKGGNDVIYVTDKDGNIHMRNFGEGAFKEYGRGKGGENGYFYLSANNEGNSKSAFEFLADHTTVEWSNTMFQMEDNSISNYVSTNHHETMVDTKFLIIDKELYDAALLKADHSHPIAPGNLYNIPSGLPDHKYSNPTRGDIPSLKYNVNEAMSKLQPIPVHRFYVQGKGYRRYHINSTYKQFNRMPNYYYEK